MRFQPVPAVFASALVLIASGCTMANNAVPSLSEGLSIQGAVHGGQQPISGSHIYLMQASNAGYGSASISLLTSGDGADKNGTFVKTDATGGFSISGKYLCVANTQVYVLAIGGNPGLAAGTNNAALALMANLGTCPASGSLAAQVPFLYMNEVTTVASVYSVSGFMTGAFAVASSPSALAATGLSNAFASSNNLVNVGLGKSFALTPAGNGIVPQATIDTLANILAACINTDGSLSPGSTVPTPTPASPCYTLFNNAKNGTTAPTDTVTALVNIAHNPSANVARLYSLSPSAAPFQPSLTTAPNDFTLQIVFSGGGIQSTNSGVHAHNAAVDGAGNVWTSNFDTASLSELSPLGVALSGTSGFTGNGLNFPVGVAVDVAGKIWVPNFVGGSVSVFNAAGTRFLGSPFAAGSGATDVALDPLGNAWVANFTDSTVTKLSNTGIPAPGSPFINNGLQNPISIAISSSGDVWTADQQNGDASAFTNTGGLIANSPFSLVNNFPSPTGNAIDSTGNVWLTDQALGRVFKLTSAGNPAANSPFSNISFNSPHSIAMDGAGAAWIADLGSNAIVALANNGVNLSGNNGFVTPDNATPDSIAVDGSGNVWYTTTSDNTMRQIIGVASPVVTPIAAGGANNTLGTRP